MRVLAISGSLRADSNNSALLRALRAEAPEGVEVEIWHGLKTIPPYDQDEDVVPGPEAVEAFRELVRGSDAVFFATPEYNSSVPGALIIHSALVSWPVMFLVTSFQFLPASFVYQTFPSLVPAQMRPFWTSEGAMEKTTSP